MPTNILGLDIGGANLKAAHTNGACRSVAFALWKHPDRLADALRDLIASMPGHEHLAVTMTGELCDCFETKREGVLAILDAVESATTAPISVWAIANSSPLSLEGRGVGGEGDSSRRSAPHPKPLSPEGRGAYVSLTEARRDPVAVAAANWLALATYASRWTYGALALLIDIGSTTTDIIPLYQGKPIPKGFTDLQRLRSGELVYTGVRRTPLCTLLGPDGIAAEFFATTHDVYLLRGEIPEDENDCDTADGRPATKQDAKRRIARMVCSDHEYMSGASIHRLADRAHRRQLELLESALHKVMETMPASPRIAVVSGSGEFLAKTLLEKQTMQVEKIVSLSEELGAEQSEAACAVAVAAACGEALV